ncbi:(p)ppGpp synthetase [Vibrio lentus]|uniref:GTP pyrophosphokinase n=1 Tax=Vibrio lentus TaxID=136468 RepID=UPI0010BDF7FB|nr:(p)ppGpp synthetase [Vibrio lentus]TKF94597.1 (p)ppGpp synthetase [Vibrio lentus]
MSSLDFDKEKNEFRDYYDHNFSSLETAKNSFVALVESLTKSDIAISKIEGRVKDREECIKKFNLKYRNALENSETEYSIKDHITDLIGLRVVCLYEDDVENLKGKLSEHFFVLDETDKITQMESTEDSFGYKGLHLDLKLNELRRELPEYEVCKDLSFEVQIRTIIQDSWSVLDHKIKYKKVIPKPLKRRINTLAALFELADREFKEIRNATALELEMAQQEPDELFEPEIGPTLPGVTFLKGGELNSFGFIKIANHFFSEYEFESHKVDGFTQEIVSDKPKITKGKFNYYIRETIATVKKYKSFLEGDNEKYNFNPYTIIRHCLYLGDKEAFSNMLNASSKESFESWINENEAIVKLPTVVNS